MDVLCALRFKNVTAKQLNVKPISVSVKNPLVGEIPLALIFCLLAKTIQSMLPQQKGSLTQQNGCHHSWKIVWFLKLLANTYRSGSRIFRIDIIVDSFKTNARQNRTTFCKCFCRSTSQLNSFFAELCANTAVISVIMNTFIFNLCDFSTSVTVGLDVSTIPQELDFQQCQYRWMKYSFVFCYGNLLN